MQRRSRTALAVVLPILALACGTSSTKNGNGTGGNGNGPGPGSGSGGTGGGAGGGGGAPASGSGGGGGAGGTAGGAGGAGGSAGAPGGGGSGGAVTNACAQAGAGGGAPNTLTVDVDAAQTVISPGIFGLLMERLGRNWNGGAYVGTSSAIPNTNGMRNDVIAGFKEAGVGAIEWPGGCAAGGYNWMPPNPANDVGTDRYMQLCSLLGIDPVIAGPGTSAGASSNLQWVTYINNNATHPDWNLKYFKVGNEVWGCGGNQTEPAYEGNYNANYTVLSPPVNGKKVNLIASTGLIGNMTWLNDEVRNIGSKIDGIEIHDYLYHPSSSGSPIPCVGFTDAQYYGIVNDANQRQIGKRLNDIIAILDQYDTAKHIKIYEDEWGDWLLPFNSAQDSWLQQVTVMDAISTAEQLHLFMRHADRVQMTGMAQGVNVIHSIMLTRSSDAALVKTPAFYVLKMLIPHHSAGAKSAPSTLVSENITGGGATFPVLSAGASVDAQGRVNISLANVDLVNTRTIQITLNGSRASYVASTAQVITGPAKDSYNDFGQAEAVNIQSLAASSCSVSGRTVRVTLPSKSVVMLVLTPQ
ncbi:MAG TPA: alpha-L-arabinofuranosidase C-terminal domain-containing protein [Tepidisphaeraceae bacterium]